MAHTDPSSGSPEPSKGPGRAWLAAVLALALAAVVGVAGLVLRDRNQDQAVAAGEQAGSEDAITPPSTGDGFGEDPSAVGAAGTNEAPSTGSAQAIAGNGDPAARLRTLSCPGNSSETASVSEDGRFFGHMPYADAASGQLAQPPSGFAGAGCGQLHGEAAAAVTRLRAAMRADDPELAARLIGLSCFRSTARQRAVFCNGVSGSLAVRAQVSAPPGFSEHHTGLAIDFGDRKVPGCNLEACFATTPVGKWLLENARSHGFELSFPAGNGQGVSYEPWHWRYVGGSGAGVFAQARSRFGAGGSFSAGARPAESPANGQTEPSIAALPPAPDQAPALPEEAPPEAPLPGVPEPDGQAQQEPAATAEPPPQQR
jgi:zinc D-Ala-D-Ala carboxypeptidase